MESVIEGNSPDLGAFPTGRSPWTAGHNFAQPPHPTPAWTAADVDWMNLISNACFETGSLADTAGPSAPPGPAVPSGRA